MTSELMEIYTDDAGVGIPNSETFTMGFWLTWRPLFWRQTIRQIRKEMQYPFRLHFHKMSSKFSDRRFKTLQRIFWELARYNRTWYFRGLHVAQGDYPQFRDRFPTSQDVYDWALRESSRRFIKGVPENNILMMVEKRNRPTGDAFIPEGLRGLLSRNRYFGDKSIEIEEREPAQDDLLQIADCFTSAVRYDRNPSGNKCKNYFAECLRWNEPMADRKGVWEYRP